MPPPIPELVPGKYARIERERRFLLTGLPPCEQPTVVRKIVDHYVTDTSLRLRHVRGPDGDQYKLTQKIPAARPGPVQGLITTIYLSKAEHAHLVAALPGKSLAKTRHSIPPLGIDIFDPPLHGLVIGEAEFASDAEMLAFQPPSYVRAEVTDDPRLTGGHLADTTREDLVPWLIEYGNQSSIRPDPRPATMTRSRGIQIVAISESARGRLPWRVDRGAQSVHRPPSGHPAQRRVPVTHRGGVGCLPRALREAQGVHRHLRSSILNPLCS